MPRPPKVVIPTISTPSETAELKKITTGSQAPNSTAGYRGIVAEDGVLHVSEAKGLHGADGVTVEGGEPRANSAKPASHLIAPNTWTPNVAPGRKPKA